MNSDTINIKLQLFIYRQTAEDRADGGSQESELEGIFRIQWEIVLDQYSSARTERKTFNMVGLRQVGADAVGCGGCGNGWISYGHAADLGRSGHISLQERRRDFENVGDVVKTITGIIAREKQARVDLQTDQVANDIAVLRAIQA